MNCSNCRLWEWQIEKDFKEGLGKGYCEKFEEFTDWDYKCVMMEDFPENLVRKDKKK